MFFYKKNIKKIKSKLISILFRILQGQLKKNYKIIKNRKYLLKILFRTGH
jgi:hypothetical protein